MLCLLLVQTGAQGFGILPGKSLSHLEITERAILKTVLRLCRTLAQNAGTAFTSPPEPLSAQSVAVACGAPKSSKSFSEAINLIILRNVRVDLRHALNPNFHFDDEKFVGGKKIITAGLEAVKASTNQGNFEAARENLGETLHPLQDFYSHSNWPELGFTSPNSNLIKPGASIGIIAAINRTTCRNCDGDNCTNNILEDIIQEKILTSGYFSVVPITSTKPKGKCSHGGAVDQTSTIEPTGGINKDTFESSHGYLHMDAANLAIAASIELLEDIQKAVGSKNFLQLMGISKGSSEALCFVIDTTESMGDDIEAVKNVTSFIIDSRVGTENEPSVYILVPFNDPDFGPLIRTTAPNLFRNIINQLSANGGGDFGEMSLSGLQLALTSAPRSTEIFLFTDAPAKDKELKNTVIALIERTKTVVNFLISGPVALSSRRRRNAQNLPAVISASDAQLYRDLAQASGGKAIEVTKSEISAATSIITESSSSPLVTLLQAARPGQADNFTFLVDESVRNLTIYITGRSLTFTLISPSGVSQQSTDNTGSLIMSSQSVGNFQSLELDTQVGQWEVRMMSANPYTLKVIGQSPIDFLFDFVVPSQGPFGGFDVLDTRPKAGVNGTLLMSVTGSESATVTDVTLVKSSGSGEIQGVVNSGQEGNFLVWVEMIPSEEFTVRMKGNDTSGATGVPLVIFQRQSPTSFRASNVTITADSVSILELGKQFSVPFSVMTSGTGGNFSIRATNDRRFQSTSPSTLLVETGGSANGTVTLTAPQNIPSGSDVTLIIEAEAPGAADFNYVVLRLSVIDPDSSTSSKAIQSSLLCLSVVIFRFILQ